MYGTLDVAAGWAEDYTGTLTDADFRKGGASPCHFRHSGKDINLLVHGDDFFAVGRESDLGYLKDTLSSRYQLKAELIGPHADDAKEIKVLGRVISYHPWGIQYEADPNHLGIALKTMGLEGCKVVVTPWVKETTMSALERNAMDARRGGAVLPCRVQEAEEDLDGDTPWILRPPTDTCRCRLASTLWQWTSQESCMRSKNS